MVRGPGLLSQPFNQFSECTTEEKSTYDRGRRRMRELEPPNVKPLGVNETYRPRDFGTQLTSISLSNAPPVETTYKVCPRPAPRPTANVRVL